MKPGYKQTEVGVIPEEWEVKTMDSLTSLMTNGFVGTATSAYVNSDDGILYIQGYNVQEGGFNLHGIKRISKAFHTRNQKSCLREGDLLTIQTGDIGVTTIVPKELVGANCHALVISRFIKQSSDPLFYCHYFNSERGRAKFKEIETGSTMKHLNVGDMKPLLIPSPPLPEQRAIAEALSDVDALIAGLGKLIAKKRDLKQAAMQQLLTGKTRLPGFSGKWEVKRLGDVVDVVGGGTPSTAIREYWNGDIDWFTPTEISGAKYSGASARKITFEGLAYSSARMLPAKTILMTTRASIGDLMILTSDATTNQGFQSLIPKDNMNNEFIYYMMLTKKNELLKHASGSTFLEISPKKVKSIELSVPPLTEQTAIAEVLSDMDAEISTLETRLEKNRALKQGMMQELLTGRIRLV